MVEAYDLEIGPIQKVFEDLYKRISEYFQSASVVPNGSIVESDLSTYSQEPLRTTLNALLEHYGFHDLPLSLRIIVGEDSQINGIHRSDNITTYEERLSDGSYRTFNFYGKDGPKNMKASYYWIDKKNGGEQTQGILTEDDKWYLRISIAQGNFYYLRMECEKAN